MLENSILPRTITSRRLDELWLHVLYTCNLKCRHCLFGCSPEMGRTGELTLAECQEYVQTALDTGVKVIYLTGGEPLLWSNVREFLTWYYDLEKVLPLTILTNGTLIDQEQARFFSNFTSQGLNLRVSLECYTQQNHEEYRGTGSFGRALQGIKNLNGFGIRPWVAYVNKSGGCVDGLGAQMLETDFRQRLGEEYGLEIAGLKIIAAYSKGRFANQVDFLVGPEKVAERINSVQCNYGVAISKDGVFPCPILVDVPQAKLSYTLQAALIKPFNLDYEFCKSCFATGTCCGQ